MTTPTRRGTSNGNDRGSNRDRAARRAWLLATFAADRSLYRWTAGDSSWISEGLPEVAAEYGPDWSAEPVPTCRCYRCGKLLWDGSLTVDRIIPGVKGGTYRRNNIRPACGKCNSETGGALARRGGRR